ncbi:hypothetical protein McanMca71_000743 [Microsporum canis]|uniref:Uncharacterized protein n=1 Tax=Arthroderma otae (strain ATCC MYA-4605 / CBS 113480) TaxID=554155 RepID=C5FLI1_ARTOC|nr:conserved hypothetical protein [Microsporum canis CBS 113480]EEQ30553.1 conserved hypothetical protein [Microsporum canis CBS 113480]
MALVPEGKAFLEKDDFKKGLEALDEEMGKNEMVVAFAPIRLIAAGGFLAVMLLQNRTATGDLDYLIEPEWATDIDIQKPLKDAIVKVSRDLDYNIEWANEDLSLFVTMDARDYLFSKAKEQNIVLFKGAYLIVLAAPIEWALERKIRRIHAADRGRKTKFDLSDCLAMLRYLRGQQNGPLDREHIRTLNVNNFDIMPDEKTMDIIATAYREKFDEEIFKS